jgi:hypothetical protein
MSKKQAVIPGRQRGGQPRNDDVFASNEIGME